MAVEFGGKNVSDGSLCMEYPHIYTFLCSSPVGGIYDGRSFLTLNEVAQHSESYPILQVTIFAFFFSGYIFIFLCKDGNELPEVISYE
jgi:hypothetical protein